MNIEIARIDFIATHRDPLSTNADVAVEELGVYRVQTGQSGYSVFQPISTVKPEQRTSCKSFNYPSDPDQASEVIRQYGLYGIRLFVAD